MDQDSDKPTFYVASAGNDGWSGLLPAPSSDGSDGPFATLSRARVATRAIGTETPRRIVIRGGVYEDVTLELYAKDSNLTIEAAPGESAVLYGGHRLTGWVQEDEGPLWRADLPGVREGKWAPRLFQVNGEMRQRARLPETGAFTHESVFNVSWMSTTDGGWERKPTPEELTTLKYREGDLGSWLEVRDAELTIYHAWDDSTVGLRSIDTERRIVTFSSPAGHPPGAFADWNPHAQTYVVWNVRQGMTRPGQWYVDHVRGQLVYWPLPDETMAAVEAVVPAREWIIRFSSAGGGAVRNVNLRGLTLGVTTTPLVAGGFGAEAFDGAITGDATLIDCELEDLTVRNVAGHGIKLRSANNRSVAIVNNEIDSAGAGGIYITGTRNEISNNRVAHVGLMYPAAIGIFGGGDRNSISHNDIHDTSYTGINGGGGTGNVIEYNCIARVMQTLNDGGAIYSIFARELVIRGNVARDIALGAGGNHAYYLDEGSHNCLVTGNLSIGVASPVQNHMAHDNRIENNIFVNDGDIALNFVRSAGYTLTQNVVYATGQIVIHNIGAIEAFNQNIFFSRAGAVEARQYQGDAYRLIAIDRLSDSPDTRWIDPGFIDARGGDFHFTPDSPAVDMGIQEIDFSRAGRSSDLGH